MWKMSAVGDITGMATKAGIAEQGTYAYESTDNITE